MGKSDLDVIIAGAGPAGLIAACLLTQAGLRALLLAGTAATPDDPRTVALMRPSIRLLERLALWPGALQDQAAPLRRLRLIDDTGSPFPAPPLAFDAGEIGLDAFGWNIPLARLVDSLSRQANSLGVERLALDAMGIRNRPGLVEVALSDGSVLSASAALAADGRDSRLRAAAGIAVESWTYDQTAIATSFGHSAPHRDTSSEYHRQAGPFTTVPLPGLRSSLVWMVRPERARQLMALDEASLAAEMQAAMHGELGLVGDPGPRKAFPMGGLAAMSFARSRVYLVGEAAHAVPPIGAQGLNMSLRDAAWAAELMTGAGDPGAEEVQRRYDAERRADVAPRQSVIDLMNRSLLSGFLPLEALRSLGLRWMDAFPPLRRQVMRRGIEPPSLPRLMRA